jgi:hypothetical protein
VDLVRKPPKHIYGMTVTFHVATGIDRWSAVTWTDYPISGVNVQPSHDTARTKDNTEVSLKAIVFVDSAYSNPFLSLLALQNQSEANGHQMKVTWAGSDMTVASVEPIYDEFCRLDHFEVGCI